MSHWSEWIAAHVATVIGTLLVVPFLARILRERRPQGSTIAWLLAVIAIPYVGIPLYLVIGPRKRAAFAKHIYSKGEESARDVEPAIAKLLCSDGVPEPSSHNALTLLTSGEAAFGTLALLIEGATRAIHIMTFILADDDTGNAILQKLTERAAAGVEVRVLIDGLFARKTNRRGIAALERAGGRVKKFGPLVHVPFRGVDNLRNHRKIAVFDGTSAIIGGMNLAEEYMGPRPLATRWRDLGAHVRGPAVNAIADVFRADWEFVTKEKLGTLSNTDEPGTSRLQVVPSGPDSAADSFYDAVLTACYSARGRVWIATPYFVPDDALTSALCAAARRGVDVLVIVPRRSNHALADLAGGVSLRQVERAGGRIATYPRMLHAKAMVVDGDLGIVGSANFDMRSLFLDYEIALFLYTPETIANLASWFEARTSECGRLRPASFARALGEDIGRLVAPLI